MADNVTVTFGGLEALAFDLSTAGPRATADAQDILDKGAADITFIAQQIVPVDTGATKNSIGADSPHPLHRVVGPTTDYAPHLELGTVHMGPHAFMGPAADQVAPSLDQAMLRAGATPILGGRL